MDINLEMFYENLNHLLNTEILYNNICFKINNIRQLKLINDSSSKQHGADSIQVIILESGNISANISSKTFFIQKGQIFIIPPYTDYNLTTYNSCKYIVVSFSLKSINDTSHNEVFLNSFNQLRLPFSINLESFSKPLTILEAKIGFLHLLAIIHTTLTIKQTDDEKNNISTQIITYLNEHYASSIQYSNIAKAFNMSQRNIARIFKAQTNMTITYKLNEIRINAAKEYLKNGASINETATKVGYTNEYYFSATFKKYTGISPSKFRNLEKELRYKRQ